MKAQPGVVERLNAILRNELTAINQYFLHARMHGNWGYERLEEKAKEESIGEMKHADRLIRRILMLDGLPNLQDLGRLRVGETPKETLECDLALERDAHPALVEAIAHCEGVGDYVSRELLEDILESEEEHIDWLETQLRIIDTIGIERYLQSHLG